jgi:hypothetical protein
VVGAALAACAEGTTSPTSRLSASEGPSLTREGLSEGTALRVTKTATGFYEERRDYDWTLTKRVKEIMDEKPGRGMFDIGSTTDVEIPPQEVRWIEYEINAARDEGTLKRSAGVRGEICVKNEGDQATKDLAIVDVVRAQKGGERFEDVTTTRVDVSAKPVLQPGERHCYPYEIAFSRVNGAKKYRNTARVSIANYAGHSKKADNCDSDDEESGAEGSKAHGAKADFKLPETPVPGAAMDAQALIHDGLNADNEGARTGPCAEHFYLYWCSTGTEHEPWPVDGTRTITFIIDMHNFWGCGDSFDFKNTATLTEGGTSVGASGTQRSAEASVRVTSGACAPNPGCTEKAGFWKQTSNLWPDERVDWPMFIDWNWKVRTGTEFFDSGKTWQQTLDAAARSGDAYLGLAQQYIAATLNRANGAAMPQNVREAYAAAAHYLSLLPDQRALTRSEKLGEWAYLLASYNEGKQGVPRCK